MSEWRDEINRKALARLDKALPEVFPPPVLTHAMGRRFTPPMSATAALIFLSNGGWGLPPGAEPSAPAARSECPTHNRRGYSCGRTAIARPVMKWSRLRGIPEWPRSSGDIEPDIET
jgi:hypothetical protein